MLSDRKRFNVMSDIMKADDWTDLGRRIREAAIEAAALGISIPQVDPVQPIETPFPEHWEHSAS